MIWAWRFIIAFVQSIVSSNVFGPAAIAGGWNLQGCFIDNPITNHASFCGITCRIFGYRACERRKIAGVRYSLASWVVSASYASSYRMWVL